MSSFAKYLVFTEGQATIYLQYPELAFYVEKRSMGDYTKYVYEIEKAAASTKAEMDVIYDTFNISEAIEDITFMQEDIDEMQYLIDRLEDLNCTLFTIEYCRDLNYKMFEILEGSIPEDDEATSGIDPMSYNGSNSNVIVIEVPEIIFESTEE